MGSRLQYTSLLLIALAGCTYDKSVAGWANGAEGNLFFTTMSGRLQGSDLGVVPIGATRTVFVQRIPDGTVDCRASTKHVAALSANRQLGVRSGPPIPLPGGIDDSCDAPPSEPIAFVSAECDGDTCAVEPADADGGLSLRVTAKTEDAVDTRLHVTVRSTKTNETFADSLPIMFAKAARITLVGERNEMEPLAVGRVLPGIRFPTPRATVVDEASREMSFDGSLEASMDGSALVRTTNYQEEWEAAATGMAHLRWELQGVITRTVDIEVVEPALVASIEVSAASSLPKQTELDDVTPLGAPVAEIDATRGAYDEQWSTQLTLDDGRRALGPIANVTTAPSALSAEVHILDDEPWTFRFSRTPVEGSGTVTITLADKTTTLPLHIASRQ